MPQRPPGDREERRPAGARPAPLSLWPLVGSCLLSAAVFLWLTLPAVPFGPVIGTGQDEWYNMIRGLKVLYERLNPSYFIHPALYYELLALLYAIQRLILAITGNLGAGFMDYFLAHEETLLAVARGASVAGGALAAMAATWLGTGLSGAGAGLLAGALIASLPLLRTMATCIRVDTLALAAMVAATALIVRRQQRSDRRSLVLAAAGIGVAAAANYPGALLLVLLGWFEWMRAGDEPLAQRVGAFALACGLAFTVFLAFNPYVLINPPQFLRWFLFQANVALTTHPHGQEPNPLRYAEVLYRQGLPVAIACIAGALAIVQPRRPQAPVAAFALLYLAGFSAMRTQYDRFALPGIALLCIAGTAAICALLTALVGRRVATGLAAAAVVAVIWSAAPTPSAMLPSELPDTDYRAEMFEWVTANLSPTATLLFESDTLPLLQEAYDPGVPDAPFATSLRQAFTRRHPRLPKTILKTQYIGAVYNYDPKLLQGDQVFFLASSRNRPYIEDNRTVLAEPAAFYEALDAAGASVVHETGGVHEQLILYAVGRPPRPDGRGLR